MTISRRTALTSAVATVASLTMPSVVRAQAARELFYGPQPKRAASRLPQSFGAIGAPLVSDQSR